jgi:hypothetical protein
MLALLLQSSDESWLNATNAILGIVTLVCLLVVAFGVFQTVMDKIRSRAGNRSVFVYDDHTMSVPELGLTMADGGEPVDHSKRDQKNGRK